MGSSHVTLGRRVRTVPLVFVGFALTTVALPVLAAAALLVDVWRRATGGRPRVAVRLVAMLWVYLAMEMAGILGLLGIWLLAGPPGEARRRRIVDWTYAVQSAWASALFWSLRRLFSLRLDVEGDDVVKPGPVLVLMRHASIVDTLLPSVLVTRAHGVRLRYVLKQQLLFDPCLDIAGGRLPNAFVRRGSGDSEREIARVRALARDLGANEGVLIYPEGTRFTEEGRRHVLEHLARNGGELHRRAQAMTNVLPPRLGGTLALLEGNDQADVVICAHHGLEGLARVKDIWNGDLVGRCIAVCFWRRPRAQLPASRDERVRWLLQEWEQVDAWINRRSRRTSRPAAAVS
jgi:1-acyl-sn-glycerol-3-phosphate acyltransferase